MAATHHSPQIREESHQGLAIIDLALLPDSAFLREADLIRSKRNPYAVLPFSSASLWRMVADGRFPKPVKLSERVTAWTAGSVRKYLASCGSAI